MTTLPRLLCGAALLLAARSPLAAQTVTIGEAGEAGTACQLFGCDLGSTRYQQVYDASAFGGAYSFNTINFFFSSTLGFYDFAHGTYEFYFTTTAQSVGGLSLADFDANLSGTAQYFATLVIGEDNDVANQQLRMIVGNSYTYDPTFGNLLMDVRITHVAQNPYEANPPAGLDYTASSLTSAASWRNGAGVGDFAAVTEFTTTPEPGTFVLLGSGLAAVAIIARRRKKAA